MKIVKYELSLVQKKELILTMEDNVDSENLLKIFLETQVKEEKEQDGLIGIIAEKVSEESCTEQCESCQKFVRRVKNVWQLMKMYAVQSVNICVKLVGDVN